MLEVIQSVLHRLQQEYGSDYADAHFDSESEYEPTESEEEGEDEDSEPEKDTACELEPITEHIIFRKPVAPNSSADCSICVEAMRCRQHGTRLLCGHELHRKGVHAWLARDKHMRCPVCRAPTINASAAASRRRSSRLATLV